MSRTVAVLLSMLGLAAPAAARAQPGHDVQVHALGLVGGAAFVGGGMGGGLRFGHSARAALLASGGWLEDGGVALRGEALGTFHLISFRPRAPGVYAGGGVAGVVTTDDVRGYLVLLLGVEQHPLAGGGWFFEIGVGGGLRVSAGFRIVRLSSRRR